MSLTSSWKRLTALLFAHHKDSATLVFGLCSYRPLGRAMTYLSACLLDRESRCVIHAVLPYAFDDLLNHEGSIVVFVSPLIALMKDQVSSMIIHILNLYISCYETGIDLICEGDVCSLYSWVGDPK